MAIGILSNGKDRKPQAAKLAAAMRKIIETNGPGAILLDADIATIISEEPRTHGFGTVVWKAWNIVLRETGYKVERVRGVGYQVPTGDGQIKSGTDITRRAVRGLKRAAVVIAATADERLTPAGIAARDFALSRLERLKDIAVSEVKIIGLGKAPALPKPE